MVLLPFQLKGENKMKIQTYHSCSDAEGKSILAFHQVAKFCYEGKQVLFVNFDVLGVDSFLTRPAISDKLLTLKGVLSPTRLTRDLDLPEIAVKDDNGEYKLTFDESQTDVKSPKFQYLGVSLEDSLTLGEYRSEVIAHREAGSLLDYLNDSDHEGVFIDMPRAFGSEYRALATLLERNQQREASCEAFCVLRPEYREVDLYKSFDARKDTQEDVFHMNGNKMKVVLSKYTNGLNHKELGIEPDLIIEWFDLSTRLLKSRKNSEGHQEIVLPRFDLQKYEI